MIRSVARNAKFRLDRCIVTGKQTIQMGEFSIAESQV